MDMTIPADDICDWLGFRPRKIKNRLWKKWMNRIKRQVRPCEHRWKPVGKGEWRGWSRCDRCRAYLSPEPGDA